MKRFVTYGLSTQADIRATHIRLEGGTSTFVVHYKGYRMGEITYAMPGAHNVLNALACVAVAMELDVPFNMIQEGFIHFGGVGRRFQVKGEIKDIMVVDDYGHHPAEIRATLAAAKSGWSERRLVVAFQPHRYTRTKELFDDFVKCFYDADVLILTDIYAASEKPIEGVSAEALVAAIKKHGQRDVTYIADRETLPEYLAGICKPDDIMLTLGAGNIWQAGEGLLKRLQA
jgi:UDP-N-acetylmuramate--alanine ligase